MTEKKAKTATPHLRETPEQRQQVEQRSFKFGISVLSSPQQLRHVLGDDAASSLLKRNLWFAVSRCSLTLLANN
jgi:hypothetical protein